MALAPALGGLVLPVLRSLGAGDWRLLKNENGPWFSANCDHALQNAELAICSFVPTRQGTDTIRFARIDGIPNYDMPSNPYLLTWNVKALSPPVVSVTGVGVGGAAAASEPGTLPGPGGRRINMRGVRLDCYTPGVVLTILYFQGDSQGHAASFQQDLATAKTLAQRIIAALPKTTALVDEYGMASPWPGQPAAAGTATPATNAPK